MEPQDRIESIPYTLQKRGYEVQHYLYALRKMAFPLTIILAAYDLIFYLTGLLHGPFLLEFSALLLIVFIPIFLALITWLRFSTKGAKERIGITRTVWLTEEELGYKNEGYGEGTVKWRAFRDITVAGGWTFFMPVASRAALPVPDSAFPNPEDLARFKALVEIKRLEAKARKPWIRG